MLEQLAKALAQHAVCFVLAYRPPQLERLQSPSIEALEQFTRIDLSELTQAEAESVIRAKLAQLYPARGGALPSGLVEALIARAQGNPFFIEEALRATIDAGRVYRAAGRWRIREGKEGEWVPSTVQSVVLSRVDRLSPSLVHVLQTAAVIGRACHVELLQAVSGRSAAETIMNDDPALRAGVFRPRLERFRDDRCIARVLCCEYF